MRTHTKRCILKCTESEKRTIESTKETRYQSCSLLLESSVMWVGSLWFWSDRLSGSISLEGDTQMSIYIKRGSHSFLLFGRELLICERWNSRERWQTDFLSHELRIVRWEDHPENRNTHLVVEKPDNEKGIQSETFNLSNLITRDSMSSFLDRKRNVKKIKW